MRRPAEGAGIAIAAAYDAIAGLVRWPQRRDRVVRQRQPMPGTRRVYSVPLRSADQILTGRAEYGSKRAGLLAGRPPHRRPRSSWCPNDEYGQLDCGPALERLAGECGRPDRGQGHVPTSGGLVSPAAQIGQIARACGGFIPAGCHPVGGPKFSRFDVWDAVGLRQCLPVPAASSLRGPRGSGFLWGAHRSAGTGPGDPFVAEIGSATWDGHPGFSPGRPAPGGLCHLGAPATSTSLGDPWAPLFRQALALGLRRRRAARLSRWAPGSAVSSRAAPA